MVEHAYIHIPFCLRKCHYCSFISGFDINKSCSYIEAIIKEINHSYKNEKLKTIYFGGGTPSLLKSEELKKILSCFNYDELSEITIEVNPETVSFEKILRLKEIGFNRISLGIQTFNDDILKLIGRNHTEVTIYNAINDIKNAGFENISVDLIYGLPNQNIELFRKDLEKATNLDIQHISTYGLKIEENSFFGNNPPDNIPNDETQAEMYTLLCDFLKKNSFEHYEISNFSKKNFQSRHNNAYWENKNYYGFGLNASGYEKNIRYRNTANFEDYINNPLLKEEKENLSKQETMENEIFLALRLKKGIDINLINKTYEIDFEKKYKKIIEKYTHLGLMKIENKHCFLTQNGILLSNNIMSEFID